MGFPSLISPRKSWKGHICLVKKNTTDTTVIVKVRKSGVSHKPEVIRSYANLTCGELLDEVLCQPTALGQLFLEVPPLGVGRLIRSEEGLETLIQCAGGISPFLELIP